MLWWVWRWWGRVWSGVEAGRWRVSVAGSGEGGGCRMRRVMGGFIFSVGRLGAKCWAGGGGREGVGRRVGSR